MRGTHSLAVAGLLNILALAALFIGNAGWLYNKRCNEFSTPTLNWNDAPQHYELRPLLPRDDEEQTAANHDHTDDDDGTQIMVHTSMAAESSSRVVLACLKWEESLEDAPPPQDWSFQMPKFCNTNTTNNFHYTSHSQQKIIVHYHMQHNAGTELVIKGIKLIIVNIQKLSRPLRFF